MIIGVPKEVHRHEHRVGLNPFAVSRLTADGHVVLIESGAGEAARFSDHHYQRAGGKIVYGNEEVCGRADLVCRVGVLSRDEIDRLKPASTVCAFHHLAVAPREHIERLIELGTTLVGYEVIRDADGELPVLVPFSEMGGRMAVHVAAHQLQNEQGGRGVLVGNIPGVPPPTVLILGAGRVGRAAARQALASGAHVIVLDAELAKLRRITHELPTPPVTAVAAEDRLAQYTRIADVVIGAVLVPGGRAPFLVSEAMVREMKPGSVIIDVAIDQGGCVETSRPTTLDHPTYTVHDVVHYCVPNMTANVARTASRALANAAMPYLTRLAGEGVAAALRGDAGLAAGVYLYRGRLTHPAIAESIGVESTPLARLLDEGGGGR